MKNISRRKFIKNTITCAGGLALTNAVNPLSCFANSAPNILSGKFSNKVMILGIDGMDPKLLRTMMSDGDLPNFRRLAEMGYFGELQTTMPPQSPVAWSSFITGTNPGGHGIYDFIHRDAKDFTPYLSTSRSYDGKKNMQIGSWKIPLDSGRVELKRGGTAFWDILAKHDIPSTIYSLPANFPVEDSGPLVRGLSGMGTPDLLGSYGRYTVFSEAPIENSEKFSSGQVKLVKLEDHSVNTVLRGPRNSFRTSVEYAEQPLKIIRDPLEDAVKIDIAGQEIILKKGEWSEWVPLSFSLIPLLASVNGVVRFYIKDVHPNLCIYASPINIDPVSPSLPICSPAGYSKEIADAVGRFYTQGLPADTKALSEGMLSSGDFWEQAKLVLHESLRAFEFELSRFHEGCFVFYFSSIDQCSHMLMRCMDPSHPLYEPDASNEVKRAIKFLYKTMDQVVGRALDKAGGDTSLFVLSDHGFTSFTREFHLSTWLVENGFTVLTRPEKLGEIDFFNYVDWKKTKAYALGINGIYINLRGREKNGSVNYENVQQIKDSITAKLEQVEDQERGGKRVVQKVYDSSKIYSGDYTNIAPDLLVGYAGGYRISDESVLGKFPKGIIGNRTDPWSSDHCMDPSVVPGILLSNKNCKDKAAIWDLAPTILDRFGIATPLNMDGKPISI